MFGYVCIWILYGELSGEDQGKLKHQGVEVHAP